MQCKYYLPILTLFIKLLDFETTLSNTEVTLSVSTAQSTLPCAKPGLPPLLPPTSFMAALTQSVARNRDDWDCCASSVTWANTVSFVPSALTQRNDSFGAALSENLANIKLKMISHTTSKHRPILIIENTNRFNIVNYFLDCLRIWTNGDRKHRLFHSTRANNSHFLFIWKDYGGGNLAKHNNVITSVMLSLPLALVEFLDPQPTLSSCSWAQTILSARLLNCFSNAFSPLVTQQRFPVVV